MARDGAGVYSAPSGTTATTATTIASAPYNAFVNDLVTDANTARPVVAGGTGATSASGARTALGVPGKATTETISGAWTVSGAWTFTVDVKTDAAASVEWELDKGGSTYLSRLWGLTSGSRRWAMDLGDATAEAGSDAGSDFALKRYDDAGTLIDNAFRVFRSNGQGIFYGEFVAPQFGFQSGTGVGGSVTQTTSKSTGVTLNKRTGTIITHDAALAAGDTVQFTMANSTVGTNTIAILQVNAPTSKYRVDVTAVSSGIVRIALTNITTGSLSEAVTIGFMTFGGAIT